MIRELVVISGKGGTGKTSVTASFAVLARDAVLADCDSDAADLHLVLSPKVNEKHEFRSGHEAIIRPEDCTACGLCEEYCRYDAIRVEDGVFSVDPASCEGCGVCVWFCPVDAIDFPERVSGDWMISETRCGPMVHAKLGVASENNGKLVSVVRKEARRIAEERKKKLVIVDGPPGIGCPVIASVTGASQLLVVTEPTVAGEHDLERVLALAGHFGVPAAVCVNKWDLNPAAADRIEENARSLGGDVAGRIRYDPGVTRAQMEALAVVETDAPSSGDIRKIWLYLNRGVKSEDNNRR